MLGQEGTSIKAIAFNSVENEIGAYLFKKDKKLFNIAGKLSLNEWRGQSNVEFIIDDISVNKTLKNTVPYRVTVGFHPTKRGSIPLGPPRNYEKNCHNRKYP